MFPKGDEMKTGGAPVMPPLVMEHTMGVGVADRGVSGRGLVLVNAKVTIAVASCECDVNSA
jgi:hypothetical protein